MFTTRRTTNEQGWSGKTDIKIHIYIYFCIYVYKFSLCFSKLDLFQLQRTLNKSEINGLTAYQTLVAGGCGYACQAYINIGLLHIKDTGTPCEALLAVGILIDFTIISIILAATTFLSNSSWEIGLINSRIYLLSILFNTTLHSNSLHDSNRAWEKFTTFYLSPSCKFLQNSGYSIIWWHHLCRF